jgi:catechol 2,3-dioxygenase-like lactoylglutathione lyase family enzyme
MPRFPAPKEGIMITHFIVSRDVERSRRFYTEVLGGEAVLEGELSIVALANGWVTISVGGGPTDDKPTVTLVPPSDPTHASSFLNIRVADIGAVLQAVERSRSGVLDPADRPWQRDPLLHARPRRPSDRGWPAGRARRRLIAGLIGRVKMTPRGCRSHSRLDEW